MTPIDDNYRTPGRPPKKQKNKVQVPLRCLVTIGVQNSFTKGGAMHNLIDSDYLRLAIYNQLKADGLVDDLQDDATFETLRALGFV